MEKLQRIFAEALGLPPGTDIPSLRYGEHELWDSISHMQLAAAIESGFDIMLDANDVIAMSSFQEAVRILKKHGIDA